MWSWQKNYFSYFWKFPIKVVAWVSCGLMVVCDCWGSSGAVGQSLAKLGSSLAKTSWWICCRIQTISNFTKMLPDPRVGGGGVTISFGSRQINWPKLLVLLLVAQFTLQKTSDTIKNHQNRHHYHTQHNYHKQVYQRNCKCKSVKHKLWSAFQC